MVLRPCLDCGKLTPKTRCPEHERAKERTRNKPPTWHASRNRTERQRRAKAVAQHREVYGDWCPGYGRDGHRSADLTADHIKAIGSGGATDGALQVLCRGCNGRKGNR